MNWKSSLHLPTSEVLLLCDQHSTQDHNFKFHLNILKALQDVHYIELTNHWNFFSFDA